MPADAAMNLTVTFLNPDHDWERACAVCEKIIAKGQEGFQVEETYLTLGERSFRVYLVGDTPNPTGGIRGAIPERMAYEATPRSNK